MGAGVVVMLYVEEVSGILHTSCDFVNKYITRLLCYDVQIVYIHIIVQVLHIYQNINWVGLSLLYF